MEYPDNRYLMIVCTWNLHTCLIETEHDERIPVIFNAYWDGILDKSNLIFQGWFDRFWQLGIRKNVFQPGIYSLKTLMSIPECVFSCKDSIHLSGLTDAHRCILLAIGKDGIFGKEMAVYDGEIGIDNFGDSNYPKSHRLCSLSDEFFQRIYAHCISKESNKNISNDIALIERAMKILMDSRVVIADEDGEPFYMRTLREALECETPEQIQMALLRNVAG